MHRFFSRSICGHPHIHSLNLGTFVQRTLPKPLFRPSLFATLQVGWLPNELRRYGTRRKLPSLPQSSLNSSPILGQTIPPLQELESKSLLEWNVDEVQRFFEDEFKGDEELLQVIKSKFQIPGKYLCLMKRGDFLREHPRGHLLFFAVKAQKEKELRAQKEKELRAQKEKEEKELRAQKEKEEKELRAQKEKEEKELRAQKEKEEKELRAQKEKEEKELLMGCRLKEWAVNSVEFNVEEFENREEQIKEMAEVCINNIKQHQLKASLSSPRFLLTSPQMWGSGKTTLGLAFLPVLRTPKYEPFLENLASQYGQQLVDALLNSKYVYLDLRFFLPNLKRTQRHEWVKLMILGYFFQNFDEEDRLYLAKADKSNSALKSIVDHFSVKYDCHFFFHFDEIEHYPQLEGIDTNSLLKTKEIRESFNNLWQEVFLLQVCGHNVLFTGRSSMIYALGKGWYPSTPSPSFARCLLLDPLKKHHIQEIVRKKFKVLSSEAITNWAEKIHQRTGGVPRLLEAALKFLEKEGKFANSANSAPALHEFENRAISLLEQPFFDYLKQEYPLQLNPFQSVPNQEHFERMLTMAILGIPLPLDSMEPIKYWAIDSVSDDVRVPFMEILRLYNVFIEKTDNHWRIFFPAVTLEAILESDRLGKDSPFLVGLLQRAQIGRNRVDIYDSMATLFPEIFARCIRLHLQKYLYNAPSMELKKSLPFLKGSFVGEETVLLKEVNPLKFPKISRNPTQLNKLSATNRREKLKEAEEVIQMSDGRIDPDESMEFHPDDWPILQRELLQPNRLYIPGEKSSSCDAFVTTLSRDGGAVPSLQAQIEAGRFSVLELTKEVIKVLPSYTKEHPLTLLIVTRFPKIDFGQNVQGREVVEGDGVALAYRFLADTIITNENKRRQDEKILELLPPAPQMDIVYLLQPGLEFLISPYNCHLLGKISQQK